MELQKIKVSMQPNLKATMQEMEIGQYFEMPVKHANTLYNYASYFALAQKYFRVCKTEKIVTVTRIETQENS